MQKISKRWKRVIIILFAFYGLLIAWHHIGQFMMHRALAAMFAKSATKVSAIPAKANNIQPTLTAFGSVKATSSASIAPELPGVIENISQPGQQVNKDDTLITFHHEIEQAALDSSTATLANAQTTFDRSEKLHQQKFITQAEYDNAKATLEQAKALNQQNKTTLDKKVIRAPFDGIAGITQASVGDYVQAGMPLLSLEARGPVYVNFRLPEKDFKIVQKNLPVTFTPSTEPAATFTGTITAIDSRIESDSRNFWVRATLENPEGALSTGMSGEVSVLLPKPSSVIVPLTAIHYDEQGNDVYVINTPSCKNKDAGIAKIVPVIVGAIENNMATVSAQSNDNPIAIGDCVVTAGQIKLYPNAQVVISGTGPTA